MSMWSSEKRGERARRASRNAARSLSAGEDATTLLLLAKGVVAH
jgi:hypothetical protein